MRRKWQGFYNGRKSVNGSFTLYGTVSEDTTEAVVWSEDTRETMVWSEDTREAVVWAEDTTERGRG